MMRTDGGGYVHVLDLSNQSQKNINRRPEIDPSAATAIYVCASVFFNASYDKDPLAQNHSLVAR